MLKTPRYAYFTATAKDFAMEFGPYANVNDVPIYVNMVGQESVKFLTTDTAVLYKAQFVTLPPPKIDTNPSNPAQFKQAFGPANNVVILSVNIAEDEVTGHPGFRVAFTLPYDATIGYTAPIR